MTGIARFGVSMDKALLKKFDRLISRRNYVNRSEAIRDLVRDKLVELEWENDQKDVVGTVTFVYDHHTPKISDKLVEIQHANHSRIKSSMHVHLDHHHCLEVLVVTGSKSEIHKLADEILSARGVLHGKLTTTTTGKEIR